MPIMQQTNPKDFIELLEVFRIGITIKAVDTQTVINWADAVIEHDAAPDYFVIELSMCGSRGRNELISLLNQYIGEHKPEVAGRVLLGVLYHRYTTAEIDLYRVVRAIDWLVMNREFTTEEYGFMCGVDDEYAMAVEGVYGSVEDVASYVLRFLTFYQAFHLENMAAWGGLNESIPMQVQELYNQLRKP
jgi:hypothetical protein